MLIIASIFIVNVELSTVVSSTKCFVWRRALGSGGGAASFVGGFPKMRSNFVQGVEPRVGAGYML